MARVTNPGPGQQSFEGAEFPSREPMDLNARCAFGRILTPRFFDLAPELVPAENSPEVLEQVTVDNLRSTLFSEGKQSVGGIVWNSQEYSAIARNVEALGRASTAKTLQARQLDPNVDRRNEAAERAAQNTLFGDGFYKKYYEKMFGMRESYRHEEVWLSRLLKESRTPQYAHMNAGDMLALATSTWQISFEGHILRAVSEHNGWDASTQKTAETAMRFNLFYDKQKAKIPYWRDMLDLGITYTHAKTVLLNQRLRQIERKMDK